MQSETIVVIAILVGLGVLIALLIHHQRTKEKRLAALDEITLPIPSTARTLLVLAVSSLPATGLLATQLDPWAREHAGLAMLFTLLVGVGGAFVGLRLTRRFRHLGVLRLTDTTLALEQGAEVRSIDLTKPYTLEEGGAEGPAQMPLQVLIVRQPGREVAVAYGLPLGRATYGEGRYPDYPRPLLNGEARVLHDRLRGRGRG